MSSRYQHWKFQVSPALIAVKPDGVAVARRNVIKIRRVPEILVAVLVQPIVFVVLFAYVFGSSSEIPCGS